LTANVRNSKRPRNNPAARQGDASAGAEVSIVQRQEFWQGPLPSPQTLEAFRQLVPDAPERIFAQWEEEAKHRRAFEQTALSEAAKKDRRGQFAAIAFALAALILTAFCVWMGQPWVAGILGGGTIAAVVGAFLYERRSETETDTRPTAKH
jgi:uncharacterized membrane protein